MEEKQQDSNESDATLKLLNGEYFIITNTNLILLINNNNKSVTGSFCMTNFRLFFKTLETNDAFLIDLPLGFILRIEKLLNNNISTSTPLNYLIGISINCKNGRKLNFIQDKQFDNKIYEQLVKYSFFLSSNLKCFAFEYKPELRINNGWNVYSPQREYARLLDLNQSKWRLSEANLNYKLCETYPSLICVPQFSTDKELELLAQFRSKNRLAVLAWLKKSNQSALMRSSQPLCGISGKRSIYDEAYLKNISKMNNSSIESSCLYIFDARPYLNALANCTNGGGYENEKNYDMCKVEFLKIENIHAMRDSMKDNLNLKWLEHIKAILDGCVRIVDKLNSGNSVLVHCSDGWDRTPQLTSLSMLLMDSYYRTIEGFEVLIEKEWLSFGHKFATRIGHGCDKYSDQDRSPIFLQFIDCVWQIMKQNEAFFEFNESLLLLILNSLYNCQYGTFLMDSDYEREKYNLKQSTVSLWSYVNSNLEEYRNKEYLVYDAELKVSSGAVKLWENYYFMYKESFETVVQQYDPIRNGIETVNNIFDTIKNQNGLVNNFLSSGLRIFNTMLDKN